MVVESNTQAVVKKIIEITGYPVFKTDITRDEALANPSFFVYEDKGDITQGGNGNQFLMEFIISFITTEDASIDEIELILALRYFGLIFNRTETEHGRVANTESEAKMITFNFHVPLIYC